MCDNLIASCVGPGWPSNEALARAGVTTTSADLAWLCAHQYVSELERKRASDMYAKQGDSLPEGFTQYGHTTRVFACCPRHAH